MNLLFLIRTYVRYLKKKKNVYANELKIYFLDFSFCQQEINYLLKSILHFIFHYFEEDYG